MRGAVRADSPGFSALLTRAELRGQRKTARSPPAATAAPPLSSRLEPRTSVLLCMLIIQQCGWWLNNAGAERRSGIAARYSLQRKGRARKGTNLGREHGR